MARSITTLACAWKDEPTYVVERRGILVIDVETRFFGLKEREREFVSRLALYNIGYVAAAGEARELCLLVALLIEQSICQSVSCTRTMAL